MAVAVVRPFVRQQRDEPAGFLVGPAQILNVAPSVVEDLPVRAPRAIVEVEDLRVVGMVGHRPEVQVRPGDLEVLLRAAVAVAQRGMCVYLAPVELLFRHRFGPLLPVMADPLRGGGKPKFIQPRPGNPAGSALQVAPSGCLAPSRNPLRRPNGQSPEVLFAGDQPGPSKHLRGLDFGEAGRKIAVPGSGGGDLLDPRKIRRGSTAEEKQWACGHRRGVLRVNCN